MEKVQYFSFLSEIGKIGKSLVFFRKKTAYTPIRGIKRTFPSSSQREKEKGLKLRPFILYLIFDKSANEKPKIKNEKKKW